MVVAAASSKAVVAAATVAVVAEQLRLLRMALAMRLLVLTILVEPVVAQVGAVALFTTARVAAAAF